MESDLVECVIGIGRNLFYNSPMEACVVICRNNKPNDKKNKVLFIDAKDKVTRKNAESYLEPEHIMEIVDAYKQNTDIPGFASIVNVETIQNNSNSLAIQMYVTSASSCTYNIEESLNNFYNSIKPLHDNFKELCKLFAK